MRIVRFAGERFENGREKREERDGKELYYVKFITEKFFSVNWASGCDCSASNQNKIMKGRYPTMTNFQKFLGFLSENELNHMISAEFMAWLISSGFFTAPASTKYHGNYAGGLFDHSICVTRNLVKFTLYENIVWERYESPYIIGLFHDLCKVDQYIANKDGTFSYNTEADRRHAEKSIEILEQFIELTEEERLCIRYHMGAYRTEDWQGNNEMNNAQEKYETVMFTHWADMLASKKYGT